MLDLLHTCLVFLEFHLFCHLKVLVLSSCLLIHLSVPLSYFAPNFSLSLSLSLHQSLCRGFFLPLIHLLTLLLLFLHLPALNCFFLSFPPSCPSLILASPTSFIFVVFVSPSYLACLGDGRLQGPRSLSSGLAQLSSFVIWARPRFFPSSSELRVAPALLVPCSSSTKIKLFL